jgi:hypothetical protein
MYRILKGCPRCRQFPLHMSHMHGPLEWLRHRLTRMRPYRCPACRWRGWAHQSWERRQRSDPRGLRLGRRAEDPKASVPGTSS